MTKKKTPVKKPGKKTEKKDPENVSQRRFAVIAGYSTQYISKLVKQGKLTLRDDGLINVKQGQEELVTNRQVGRGIPKMSYNDARTTREIIKAKIAELEYEEKIGKLIPAVEVQQEAFKQARQIRDAFLVVPDRVAPVIAAEDDVNKVHKLLRDEIKGILNRVVGNDA